MGTAAMQKPHGRMRGRRARWLHSFTMDTRPAGMIVSTPLMTGGTVFRCTMEGCTNHRGIAQQPEHRCPPAVQSFLASVLQGLILYTRTYTNLGSVARTLKHDTLSGYNGGVELRGRKR